MNGISSLYIIKPNGERWNDSEEIVITSDALWTQELMSKNEVQLSWKATYSVVIPVGSYISVNNEKFTLLEPYQPDHINEEYYKYEPVFVAEEYTWAKYPFFLYTTQEDGTTLREPSWTITDSPSNIMQCIVDAINNETTYDHQTAWTAVVNDDDFDTASATLSFEDTDILSALNALADEFETEWFVDKGNYVIYLKTALVKDANDGFVDLVVGTNVSMPEISEDDENEYYNRFYVFGSTRNIVQDTQLASTNTVVNKRLTLDSTNYPDGYIDIEDGSGHVFSKILYFEDIYPHADLIISNVVAHLKYKDDDETDPYYVFYIQVTGSDGSTFSFDPSTYDETSNPDGNLISGETLGIYFKSGSLQGREFDLECLTSSFSFTDEDGNRQTLSPDATNGVYWYCIQFIEESNYIIPSESLSPAVNDELTIFNCRMPDAYVTTAQAELLEEANKEIASYNQDTASYTVDSYADKFYNSSIELEIGTAVTLDRTKYGTLETRVMKIERCIDLPYVMSITVGNERQEGTISNLKEEVAKANTALDTVTTLATSAQRAQQNLPRQFTAVQETASALMDSKLDNFTAKITPIVVQTMQTIVGDSSLQYRFTESATSTTEVYLDIVWDSTSRQLSIAESYLQHMTYGIEDTSTEEANETSRQRWTIEDYESEALTDTEQSYYLYALCNLDVDDDGNYVSNGDGRFELTDVSHSIDEESDKLWLLVGILSSEESDGTRSFARMYGYTEILPGQVSTSKLVSTDGNTGFDLINGNIWGNITFSSTNQETIKEIVTTQVSEAVAEGLNVEVGATNLLAICNFSSTKNSIDEDGYISIITSGSDGRSWNYSYSDWKNLELEAGSYTISYFVTTVSTNVAAQASIMSGSTRIFVHILTSFAVGKTSKTFTISEDGTYGFEIKVFEGVMRVKLERGTVATDWSPAPEDQTSYVDTQVSTLSSTVASTYVDLSTYESLSTEMQNTIDTAVGTANTASTNASTALTTANTASTNATTALSTAEAAQDAIDNLEVGGTNLLALSEILSESYSTSLGKKTILDDYYISSSSGDGRDYISTPDWWVELEEGTYVLSIWYTELNSLSSSAIHGGIGLKGSSWPGLGSWSTSAIGKITKTYTVTEAGTYWVTFKLFGGTVRAKLEKGNTGTDFSPAPEDQTAYTDEQISAVNTNVAALDYLKEAMAEATEGTTDIYGGLILTKFIGVKDENNVVVAGMNAYAEDQTLPMIFSGRDPDNGNSNGTFQVWEDGTVKSTSTDGADYLEIDKDELSFNVNGTKKTTISAESSYTSISSMIGAASGSSSQTKQLIGIYESGSASATIASSSTNSTAQVTVVDSVGTTLQSSIEATTNFTFNSITIPVYIQGSYSGYSSTDYVTAARVTATLTVSISDGTTTSTWIDGEEVYVDGTAQKSSDTYYATKTYTIASGKTFSAVAESDVVITVQLVIKNVVTKSATGTTVTNSVYGYIPNKVSVSYTYSSSIYRNSIYANGYVFANSNVNYVAACPQASGSNPVFEARASDYSLRVTNNGLKWSGAASNSVYVPIQPIFFVGYATYSTSGWTLYKRYNPYNDTFNIDGSSGTGIVTISWEIGQTNPLAFGVGRETGCYQVTQISSTNYQVTLYITRNGALGNKDFNVMIFQFS